MKGKVIIVVGARGSGKSTLTKKLIEPIHPDRLFCYDVQNEYGVDDFDELPDIEAFTQLGLTVNHSVLVFEEATAFFSSGAKDKNMRKILINSRHALNVIILVFHSIRSIPTWIFDLTDYVYLLRTNDTDDVVKRKLDILYDAYLKVKEKPKYSYEFVNIFETV